MADESNKPLDEAHRPGGLYRVGDKVVDAEGKDLGEEGLKLADEQDAKQKAQAEEQAAKDKQNQALLASGGLAQALQTLAAGVAQPAPAASTKKAPANKPAEVTIE